VLIGELAEHLGINPRTIRYYESIGLLPEPERSESGYRVYGEADVERLVFIKAAQRLGLALDEVREILALRDRGVPPCGHVRSVLRRQVSDIDRQLAELHHLREELVALDLQAQEAPFAEGAICGLIEHVRQRLSVPAGSDDALP
jgi:DNA-binding transcriptional MerR regulator